MLNIPPNSEKPKTFKYEITKLDESEKKWFGSSYLIRVTNYNWFPKQKIMGVVDNFYKDTNKIGVKLTGNMGSATVGVENIEKAKELLGIN